MTDQEVQSLEDLGDAMGVSSTPDVVSEDAPVYEQKIDGQGRRLRDRQT